VLAERVGRPSAVNSAAQCPSNSIMIRAPMPAPPTSKLAIARSVMWGRKIRCRCGRTPRPSPRRRFRLWQLPGAARDLSRSLDERPANHIFPKTLCDRIFASRAQLAGHPERDRQLEFAPHLRCRASQFPEIVLSAACGLSRWRAVNAATSFASRRPGNASRKSA